MIRLFRVFIPSSVLALLVSEVILIYTCYVVATFVVLHEDPQVFLLYDNGWWKIAVVAVCVVVGIYFHDLYQHFRIKSRILLLQQMGLVVGIVNWTIDRSYSLEIGLHESATALVDLLDGEPRSS